jgi:phage FluMu gp28-like protein
MNSSPDPKYFIRSQVKWIDDDSPLKIMEKSRQVGGSNSNDYRTVGLVCAAGARFDAFISTRDQVQAKLSLENCKSWADFFHTGAVDLGEIVFDRENNISAYALEFANRRRIYALSSNPNALAGKCGHIILDEFALHKDQRMLYRIAKPATTWGGTMTIISTHRGVATEFNKIIRSITEAGNPMGWSHHKLTIHQAVRQGIVERINKKSGRDESRLGFIRRLRAECIDEEQWLQEYCCVPADESSAFFSHEMITACEDNHLRLLSFEKLHELVITNPKSSFYLGMDAARKENLCVIDVGEKVGDVVWDRMRIELRGKSFSEIEFELYRLLSLPHVKRACMDATGMGMQLAERARERFGWKVEPVTFTPAVKEELAFGLRRDFEDRKLRMVRDDNLRSDLRALKKEVTSSGNIRFAGEAENSHCDRTWAKALRQHAARYRPTAGGAVA